MGDEVTTDVAAAGGIQPSFADRAEYAALRGAVAALERLSFTTAGKVGERIARLGYAPLGIRREVVVKQLTKAFPDKTSDEIERIARGAYGHLGRTSIETAVLPSYSRTEIVSLFES